MPCAPTSLLADADAVVQIATQRPFTMSNPGSYDDQRCGDMPRYRSACDKSIAGWVLLTLVRAGEVLAGDQVSLPDAPKPDFGLARHAMPLSLSMAAIPAPYLPLEAPEAGTFSAQDFRPRAHSVFDSETRAGPMSNTPVSGETTVWQRLSEFRSHNRIRVLTLWETGGSSVSLQAGRKGDPSLQWTSRLMNRGGATHGLLDRIFSTSLAGAGRSLHLAPHTNAAEPALKPAKLPDGAPTGIK